MIPVPQDGWSEAIPINLGARDDGFRFALPILRTIDSRVPFPLRHCERSEAIHGAASRKVDCFAEPVIGRRFAPTRWLAMTAERACAFSRRDTPEVCLNFP